MGSHIAESLLKKDYQVRIFDKINVNKKNIDHLVNDIELIEGDFNNEVDIKTALEGIDYIIHLASATSPQPSYENPVYDLQANVIPTLCLLAQASKIKKIKRIIFSSSGGTVYGIPQTIPIDETHPTFPICPYGISKLSIEKYIYYFNKIYGLNYIVLRISNAYGERQNLHGIQGIIPVLLGKILENIEIEIWGDGKICRDFIYVKDVSDSVVKSVEAEYCNTIYNVGSGDATSLNELLTLLEEVTGEKIRVRYTEKRAFDIPVNVLKIDKIRKELGWKPRISLKEGLKTTWEYVKHESDMIAQRF